MEWDSPHSRRFTSTPVRRAWRSLWSAPYPGAFGRRLPHPATACLSMILAIRPPWARAKACRLWALALLVLNYYAEVNPAGVPPAGLPTLANGLRWQLGTVALASDPALADCMACSFNLLLAWSPIGDSARLQPRSALSSASTLPPRGWTARSERTASRPRLAARPHTQTDGMDLDVPMQAWRLRAEDGSLSV